MLQNFLKNSRLALRACGPEIDIVHDLWTANKIVVHDFWARKYILAQYEPLEAS